MGVRARFFLFIFLLLCCIPPAFILTTLLFHLHYRYTHPSLLSYPLIFQPINDTLQSYFPLSISHVKSLQLSLTLHLPESPVNFQHSVFPVSARLYSSNQCIHTQLSTASIRFRSPIYSAIRSFILFIPLFLGFVSEYQTLSHPLLRTKFQNVVHIDALNITMQAPIQVSSAMLHAKIGRQVFWKVIIRQKRIPLFLFVTASIWSSMVFVIISALVLVHIVRRCVSSLVS